MGQEAFFDAGEGFSPKHPILQGQDVEEHLLNVEVSKERCYEQRARDAKRAAFKPLIISSAGGMASECTTSKHLSSISAKKRETRYQHVVTWQRHQILHSIASIHHGNQRFKNSQKSMSGPY